jgi:hypothetical protein
MIGEREEGEKRGEEKRKEPEGKKKVKWYRGEWERVRKKTGGGREIETKR